MTGAQPAPRVALDVPLTTNAGWRACCGIYNKGRLTVAANGTHYVVLHEFEPAPDASASGRVSLVAIARDGTEKFKTTLPLRFPVGSDSVHIGVAAAKSGDLALFMSRDNQPLPRQSGRPQAVRDTCATLFHLGPDGRLKKETAIGPPRQRSCEGNIYEIEHYYPTPDNAVLVAGGFGSGPYEWWLGKFHLDGVRLWEAGPGNGTSTDGVRGIAVRPDGTTTALVAESGKWYERWYIHRYAANGRRVAHIRLEPYGFRVAVLRHGNLFTEGITQQQRITLVHLDDSARVLGRAPWPFAAMEQIIADGDGFAAIVQEEHRLDAPRFIVRASTNGQVHWKSPAVNVSEIVRTPDGEIAALVWPERHVLRLVHYATR